ncbi:hypothetical protein MTR67_022187, partial [Solanum verrucosum]
GEEGTYPIPEGSNGTGITGSSSKRKEINSGGSEGTSSAMQAARSNETEKLGNRGSKIGQGDIVVGESVDSPIETQTIGRKTIERGLVKETQRVAKKNWEEIGEAHQRLDQANSASSGKKSWADQVEE